MIRAVLFRMHLSVAVASGLFLVTMAVTGAVLACEDALMAAVERYRSVPVPLDARRLGPDDLVAAAEAWAAGAGDPFAAIAIEYRSPPTAAVRVHAGRDRRVFVDPYTGRVVGEGFPVLEGFFEGVLGWHRWLGASAGGARRGRTVTGVANVAFLFLLLTGPLLWIPRRVTRTSLRRRLLFRRGARGPARQRNWHRVIGIWSVPPLAVIAATGVVMSFPAVGDRVYPIVGAVMPGPGRIEPVPAGGGEGRGGVGGEEEGAGGGLASALAVAEARQPGWRSIVLAIPRLGDASVRVGVRTGRTGQPQKAAVLTVDRWTGAVVSAESFRDETPSRRAQEFLRYAHTGEYWGLAGQALAGLFTLGAIAMAWTGFSVALGEFRLWRRRRST